MSYFELTAQRAEIPHPAPLKTEINFRLRASGLDWNVPASASSGEAEAFG
jgi:hypothetical protein